MSVDVRPFLGKSMSRDLRLEIRISKGLRRAVERLSRRTGMPVSQIVRRALTEYLKKHRVIK